MSLSAVILLLSMRFNKGEDLSINKIENVGDNQYSQHIMLVGVRIQRFFQDSSLGRSSPRTADLGGYCVQNRGLRTEAS